MLTASHPESSNCIFLCNFILLSFYPQPSSHEVLQEIMEGKNVNFHFSGYLIKVRCLPEMDANKHMQKVNVGELSEHCCFTIRITTFKIFIGGGKNS